MEDKNIKINCSLQKLICFVAVILFFIKLITWYITSSISIFSDAMESITNIISGFIGLYSLHISSLPKDKNHPYGHGKIEFISTAIEGFLIFLVGIFILITTFIRVKQQDTVFLLRLDYGMFLMFFTAIINYCLGLFACKIGNKNGALTLIASGKHLQIDTYSTFGIVGGLILLNITKCIWIDSIISLIFSFIILYTGLKLLRYATAGIMDESDKKLLKKLSFYINERRDVHWIDLHRLKIIKYGSALHVDCHLTVPWFFNVKEANKEVRKLTKLTKDQFGNKVELSVHVDACKEYHCSSCFNSSCKMRKNSFQNKIIWTLDKTSYYNKNPRRKDLIFIKKNQYGI
ncbi:MAG: cation diffusion facilitator family transporter [Flavobacteriales bacterium]|jgi:cation diffusion facilitator family transporter|uniref:cation diffusion facilitator family transporter n=1 Tax=Blattabacterium sp. (Mastotermes darwiniensis) TaxID=39768 RepID=UPI000231DEC8|nr:cation diffusion facilitator family transporter [Blattabacterium sp. (Mastotermes darwiniensis)]AER40764.1 cation diffusion facilitator family transporter [Blattabacterium sp. (Mastotermes darwiniensis) str. MADAR]MDR1804607.1 cation diffusion facilitator family transporter [Flavobacteriales bacterium]